MKILILCGKYGMGHFMAARAIEEQLKKENDIEKIKLVDFVEYTFPISHKFLYSSFKLLTTKIPKIFAHFYPTVANNKSAPAAAYKMVKKLDQIIKEEGADIVISTLPEISKSFALYKEKYKTNVKLVTCVTDITYFYEWVCPASDLYLAPTADVKNYLVKSGIKEETIIVSGVPVKDAFYKFEKIKSDKFQLLLMGGGLGNIPIDKQFYNQIEAREDIETTVLCAKNKELYTYLQNNHPNINSVAFTDKIDDYFRKADLLITKTGGITTFESIFAGLPIVTYVPFLPQEANNAKYLEKMGSAKIMWDNPKNPYDLVNKILENNELEAMSANMNKIKADLDINYVQKIKELAYVK
ncbi:MAG: glycosyltransferase [Gemella sp.]|nr:glycosyltransferase [Gemella sp.]